MDEIVGRLRKEVRRGGLDGVEITRESTLSDLGLSSLQVAEVVYGIEDDFGIELDEARAADIETLADLLDLVNETLGV